MGMVEKNHIKRVRRALPRNMFLLFLIGSLVIILASCNYLIVKNPFVSPGTESSDSTPTTVKNNFSMTGTIEGESIDFSMDNASASEGENTHSGEGTITEIRIMKDNPQHGISFGPISRLENDTTYKINPFGEVLSDGKWIYFGLWSQVFVDKYNYWALYAGGPITDDSSLHIDTWDGSHIEGTFQVTTDSYSVSGSFNVDLQ
jgi:hypothetical protein